MSDTPETDDLARGNHVVPTDWAEQLERERDSLQALSQSLAETCVKLKAERDEARTTIEDAKRALIATDYEGILLAAMRVKEERDEARRVLRELKKEGNT